MERVAVERKLGSGQGGIVTRIPISDHIWSSGIVSDVALDIWYWFIGTRQFPSIPRIVVLTGPIITQNSWTVKLSGQHNL